jgi:hypothetical protein
MAPGNKDFDKCSKNILVTENLYFAPSVDRCRYPIITK